MLHNSLKAFSNENNLKKVKSTHKMQQKKKNTFAKSIITSSVEFELITNRMCAIEND